MPNLATKVYTTVAEQIYDTVKDNEWYSQDSYDAMVTATGSGDNYLGMMYSLKDKDLTQYNMSLDDYKYLNGEQKIQYLDYHINKDQSSEEFKKYKEEISQQILLAKEQETYANMGFLGKLGASTVGFLGKMLEGVIKGIEGVIDVAAAAVGGMIGIFGADTSGIKDFISKDLTGKDFLGYSEALDSFNRKYTYLDKGWFGETLSSIATGLGQLGLAFIPGVGQAAYFGGIIGNSIEESIQANPDITLAGSIFYGATIGATEGLLEKASMGVFGKTGIDNIIFKGTSTLAGKTTGSAIKRMGSDFWKEGIEEMASEITGDLAFMTFVSQDPAVLTAAGKNLGTLEGWSNVLTAGLVGGVIGSTVVGTQIGATHRAYVTSDGHLITYKDDGYPEIKALYKEGKSGVKQFTRGQTYELGDALAGMAATQGQQNVTKLQAKYSTSIDQLKVEHAEEYEAAAKEDAAIREKAINNTMWLSNIINGTDEKKFTEGLKLYQTVADKKFELLQNWANRQTNKAQQTVNTQKLIDKFETQHPGVSINIHENDLSSTELSLQREMAKLGKNVYFVDFGSETGEFYASELIDEDTIFLQKDLQNVWSLEQIQTEAIKHELIHSMQMFLGTLSPAAIMELKKLAMQRLGNNPIPSELDKAYANEKTNIKLSEIQANTLATLLVDDVLTINALFLGAYPTFKGIFGQFKKWRAEAKTKKDAKGKLVYRELNFIMNMYKAALVSNIENEEDIDAVIEALSITDEEAKDLINTYMPDEYYGNFTLLKDQFSTHGQARLTAEKNLKAARKNKRGMFDYTRAFDMEYYSDEFVKEIMKNAPDKSFKYNLQTWLRNTTNFMISQANGCLVETVDLSTEFKDDVLKINSVADFKNKVKTAKDLFKNEAFIKAFQIRKDFNSLENVKVIVKPARSSKLCDMVYQGGAEPTITVYIREDADFTNELNRNTFLGEFMGQVTLAMADAQGLAIGTSPDIVAMSLAESVSDKDIDFLAKQLFTKEYYNQVKSNKAEMIDSLSYAIYRSTDGAVLKADKKFRKAGGATPRYNTNANGFVNVYGGIHGYGIFKDIFIPQPVSVYDALGSKQTQIKEAKQADFVTLSKKESMKDFYKFTSQFTAKELVKMGVDHVIAEDIVTQQATKTDLDYAIAEGKITSDEIINAYINTYYRNNENIKAYADAKQALNILEKAAFKEDTEPVQAILAEKDDSFWIQFFIENDISPNDSAVGKKLRKKLNSLETSSAEKQISISTKDEAEESANEKTSIESLQDTRSTGSEIVDDAIGISETSTRQEHTKESVKTYTEKFFDSQAVLKQVKDMRALYLLAKGDVNKIQAILEKRPKDYAELQKMLNKMNLTFEQYVKGIIGKKANVYVARLVYDLKDRVKTPDEIDYLIKNFFTSNTRPFYMDLKTIFSNDDFATIRKALTELKNQKFPEKSEKSTEKTPVKSATTAKTEVSDEQKVVPKKAEKKPFPDSVVTEPVYHSTNVKFDTFDKKFLGSSTDYTNTKFGFFFTNSKQASKQFGKITKKCFINIKKPLNLNNIWSIRGKNDIEDLTPEQLQALKDLAYILTGKTDNETLQVGLDSMNDYDFVMELRDELLQPENLTRIQKNHDGIIDNLDNKNIEYIVFEPEQIYTISETYVNEQSTKNAEPKKAEKYSFTEKEKQEFENDYYDYGTKDFDNKHFFDTTKAGFGRIDTYLTDPEYAKKEYGGILTIEYMTPDEYLKKAAKINGENYEQIKKSISNDTYALNKIRYAIQEKNDSMCITFLDYVNKSQEGNHRMYVAGEMMGWNTKQPVAVIRKAPVEKSQPKKQEQSKTYVNEKTGQTSFLEPVGKPKAVKKVTPVKKEEPKPVEKEPEQPAKKVEDMTPEEVVEATPAQKEVDEIAAQIENLREQIAAMRKEIPKERVKCMWIDTIDNRNDGMIDGTTISFEGECYDKSTTKGLKRSSIKKLVLYDSMSGKKTEVGRYENGKWIVKPDPTYNVYISFIAASRRMLDEEYATDKSNMSEPLQKVMNTKATRIIQNQVKNMSNVDRVHQIANLKDFIQANWGYINTFTIDDFKEFVKKCLDPTKAFTGAEQNNILMLAMVLKEKQGILVEQDEKFKDLYVKLDEYLNKQLSLSGQQLSLWSRMVKEANPLMGLEREFFETFGKELEIDDELKDKYKSAIREHKFDKGEDSIAAIEKEIMEKTTEQIPEDRFKVFEHGISKDVRWQRFKNLLGTFTAFRYMAMLSNPATHMVNFVSNLGIQLMDGAAYRIMNWFSAGLKDIDGQYEYRKGALNKETVDKINERFGGLLDSIAETGKYDETGTSNLFRQATKKKVYNSKVMQACNNLIFGLLQKFDKRFVRPALAKELARLVDSNNIDLDNITPQELDKLLDNVTRRVLHSYLRDDSKASLFIENVCANHPLIGFFIKAVIPFPRVTINITRRVLEYSPVGLINGIFRWVRARKAKKSGLKHGTVLDDQFYVADTKVTMARATVGTALLIIGCILAALDILGFDDDDENNGIVFKIGDYKLSLSNIAPAATPLLLGAALKHAEDKSLTDRLLKVMNDATVLGTFNDLFVHRSNLAEYITVPAATYATQFMPAILRSIAKGIDPTKKQIEYDYNTVPGWFNTTFQRIVSGLPLGRQLLPNKVDPYTGKPALEYNSAVLPWINIFMPAKISKDTDTDLSSELKSIGAATTGASGKNMSINGQDLNLKGHDLSTFRKNRGENVNKLLNDLVNNKKKYRVQKEDGTYEELYYSNMTDKQKKNAATNLYDKATDYAKIQYWISNGHKYYTSNRDEYNTLRKAIGTQGIVYRANWKKSKYVN